MEPCVGAAVLGAPSASGLPSRPLLQLFFLSSLKACLIGLFVENETIKTHQEDLCLQTKWVPGGCREAVVSGRDSEILPNLRGPKVLKQERHGACQRTYPECQLTEMRPQSCLVCCGIKTVIVNVY